MNPAKKVFCSIKAEILHQLAIVQLKVSRHNNDSIRFKKHGSPDLTASNNLRLGRAEFAKWGREGNYLKAKISSACFRVKRQCDGCKTKGPLPFSLRSKSKDSIRICS